MFKNILSFSVLVISSLMELFLWLIAFCALFLAQIIRMDSFTLLLQSFILFEVKLFMSTLHFRLQSLPVLFSYRGIIVFNHQCRFDIYLVLYWLSGQVVFVAKKELAELPFIGFVLKKLPYLIFINRRHPSRKSIESIKKVCASGKNLVFFPEGTRSKSGKIRPYKLGAFWFSQMFDLPVLPGVISYVKKGAFMHVSIKLGQPMKLAKGENIRQFSTRVHQKTLLLQKENELLS